MQNNSKKKKIYVYSDGNTLRYAEAEALPKKKEQKVVQPEKPNKKKVSEQTRRNREKAQHMGRGMALFLTTAVCATLFVSFRYLNLMSDMKSNQGEITELQNQLDELKTENSVTYSRLNSSIDLEDIYKRATQELGMVYAVDGQIVTYTAPASEYVEQYANVPQANSNNLLDEIIEIMK